MMEILMMDNADRESFCDIDNQAFQKTRASDTIDPDQTGRVL